ncbi:MAG TPA: hypothetical protein VHO47_04690 [Candidatus Babeliales bacterium]|nr:hypothetical protein [Candidatus Babeliales bacterium]
MKKFMTFIICAFIFTNSWCDSLKEYKEAISRAKIDLFKELLQAKHKAFLIEKEWQFAEQTFQGYFPQSINDQTILQYCSDFQTLDSYIQSCCDKADQRIKELEKPQSTTQKIKEYIMPLTYMGLGSLFYYFGYKDLQNYFQASIGNLKHPLLYAASGTILLKYGSWLYGERKKNIVVELKAIQNGRNNLEEMKSILKSVETSFADHINSMKSNYKATLPVSAAKALKALVSAGLA